MRLRNRKRGITYIEVVVASAFVGICAATLADSLAFSLKTIGYVQRRTIVQTALESTIDEAKGNCLTALPTDGTTTSSFTLSGNRTVTVTQTFTRVTGKNLSLLQLSASWPEVRGSRSFNDTMTFEVYLRGPDNAG